MLDMFNNPIDPEVDYARGKILASSIDEKKKYQNAVRIIAERLKAWGEDSFYIFTGNIRNNALLATDLGLMSEEWVGQAERGERSNGAGTRRPRPDDDFRRAAAETSPLRKARSRAFAEPT